MRHYACAVIFRDGPEVLLGLRAPHRKAYAECWDVIGGRVEPGETPGDALRRELGEEVGIRPTGYLALCSLVDDGPQMRGSAVYHMFLVRQWTGAGPVMTNDEHTELKWFAVAAACVLPRLALPAYAAVFRQGEAVSRAAMHGRHAGRDLSAQA